MVFTDLVRMTSDPPREYDYMYITVKLNLSASKTQGQI